IEPHIPSEVRRPEDHQMPTRLGGSGSNRNRANETKNQEEPASRVIFRFHDSMLLLRFVFGEQLSSTPRFITIRCRVGGGFFGPSNRLAHAYYHQIPGDD